MTTAQDGLSPQARDALALMEQVTAGIVFAQERLDIEMPGWREEKAGRGRRGEPPEAIGPGWRRVYAQLVTAWVNLGRLVIDLGVPSWRLPELLDMTGQQVWRYSPLGHLDVVDEPDHQTASLPRPSQQEPMRDVPARDLSELYTLDQARQILAGEHRHSWQVDLDDEDVPFGVRCTGCPERRKLA